MVTVSVLDFTEEGPGSRHTGSRLRASIDSVLGRGEPCTLDFSDVDPVTQSFADEAVGVLVRERGPDVLEQLTFLRCSPAVRDTLQFVADDSAHYWETGSFPTPHPA